MTLRRVLIMDNPLGRKTGQLVHFAQLLVVGKAAPARLHARAARKAGASLGELAGVAELTLITAGKPGYGLGVEILAEMAAAEAAARLPGRQPRVVSPDRVRPELVHAIERRRRAAANANRKKTEPRSQNTTPPGSIPRGPSDTAHSSSRANRATCRRPRRQPDGTCS